MELIGAHGSLSNANPSPSTTRICHPVSRFVRPITLALHWTRGSLSFFLHLYEIVKQHQSFLLFTEECPPICLELFLLTLCAEGQMSQQHQIVWQVLNTFHFCIRLMWTKSSHNGPQTHFSRRCFREKESALSFSLELTFSLQPRNDNKITDVLLISSAESILSFYEH